ncbi:MAG TPA: copper amine oxidase N-terminal domain-containing protein [Fimbriimonadaceae bacterium]|jgi:uncharacterized protein YwlG (UPF0340 family)|nr:copper amine oxidase N-terminal domain-containing protein [Fimbriimonadaceae bacterium]
MLRVILTLGLALLWMGSGWPQEQPIRVYLNGSQIDFPDAQPIIKYKRVLVPMRSIFEKLGATLTFDKYQMYVTAVRGDRKVELWVGSRHAMVDGSEVLFDTAVAIHEGRVMVPLRFLSETLSDVRVHWDAKSRSVTLRTGQK